MTRLPALKAREIIRALERASFVLKRIKGSHHIMEHATDPSRRTIVPLHAGRDIPRGLLHKILTDAKLTSNEFLGYL